MKHFSPLVEAVETDGKNKEALSQASLKEGGWEREYSLLHQAGCQATDASSPKLPSRGSGREQMLLLELAVLGCAGEGNHVTDVLHACHEENQALETETETAVGAASVLARVEIPPHILHGDVAVLYLVHQFAIALLTN